MEDYYALLGISRDADQITIRRTYQRLARRFHPGLRPGDADAEVRFRAILKAYEVLSDPEHRRRYDLGEAGSLARRRGRRNRPAIAPRLRQPLDDLVVELVSLGWQPESEPAPVAGGDVEAEIVLGFEEAIRGVTTSLSVQVETVCATCHGAGGATGCGDCDGRGSTVALEKLRVRVPPGLDEGSRLRIRGKGNRGTDGRGRGDVYLTVRVRPHEYFRRRGADLFAEVPLRIAEAVLGAEVEVPTIDGQVRVEIPAGTSGGTRFRLRGRGVAQPDGRRGDHYYTVRIVVPRQVDAGTRRLLEQISEEDPRRGLPHGGL